MIETVTPIHSAHDFETLGFNAEWEVNRRRQLIERFGQLGAEVARFEHERSLSAYKREFIDDIPYSAPQIYYDDLLTMPLRDHLFEMNVDPDERGGFTQLGFEELRCRVREAREALKRTGKESEVVLWYSPPGKAGEGKFEHLEFDSGRLYPIFVRPDSFSVSFDIKVLEELFPIADFLNHLSDSQQVRDSWYYLTHAFRTGKTADEFVQAAREWGNRHIYTRHRYTDPQLYNLDEVLDGIQTELADQDFRNQLSALTDFEARFNNFVYLEAAENYLSADYERSNYMRIIGQALVNAQRNGQEGIVLYGCSATGVRTPDQLKKFDFSAKAIFETSFRIVTAENLFKKTDYEDDPNLCRCSKGSGPHFHCPGKEGESCGHAVVVGQGVEQCPSCGKDKTC